MTDATDMADAVIYVYADQVTIHDDSESPYLGCLGCRRQAGAMHKSWCRLLLRLLRAGRERTWPEGVATPLIVPCSDCAGHPKFDYTVNDEFWKKHVRGKDRLGVLCLPCLDRRCQGEGLPKALTRIQWTGTGHTLELSIKAVCEYHA